MKKKKNCQSQPLNPIYFINLFSLRIRLQATKDVAINGNYGFRVVANIICFGGQLG